MSRGTSISDGRLIFTEIDSSRPLMAQVSNNMPYIEQIPCEYQKNEKNNANYAFCALTFPSDGAETSRGQ